MSSDVPHIFVVGGRWCCEFAHQDITHRFQAQRCAHANRAQQFRHMLHLPTVGMWRWLTIIELVAHYGSFYPSVAASCNPIKPFPQSKLAPPPYQNRRPAPHCQRSLHARRCGGVLPPSKVFPGVGVFGRPKAARADNRQHRGRKPDGGNHTRTAARYRSLAVAMRAAVLIWGERDRSGGCLCAGRN